MRCAQNKNILWVSPKLMSEMIVSSSLPSVCPLPQSLVPGLWGGVLVEDTGHGHLIYGPWATGFGCWREEDGVVGEHIPDAPVFDRLGRWSDPPGVRTKAWFAARAARTAYLAAIPAHVRVIVGQAPRWQWLLLDMAARSDGLLRQMDRVLMRSGFLSLMTEIDRVAANVVAPADLRLGSDRVLFGA